MIFNKPINRAVSNKKKRIIGFTFFFLILLTLVTSLRLIESWVLTQSKEGLQQHFSSNYQSNITYSSLNFVKKFNHFHLKIENFEFSNNKFNFSFDQLFLEANILNHIFKVNNEKSSIKVNGLTFEVKKTDFRQSDNKEEKFSVSKWLTNFKITEPVKVLKSIFFDKLRFVEFNNSKIKLYDLWQIDAPNILYNLSQTQEQFVLKGNLSSKREQVKELSLSATKLVNKKNSEWQIFSEAESIVVLNNANTVKLISPQVSGSVDVGASIFNGKMQGKVHDNQFFTSNIAFSHKNLFQLILINPLVNGEALGRWKVSWDYLEKNLAIKVEDTNLKSVSSLLPKYLIDNDNLKINGSINSIILNLNLMDNLVTYVKLVGEKFYFEKDNQFVSGLKNASINLLFKNNKTNLKLQSPHLALNLPKLYLNKLLLENVNLDIQLKGEFNNPRNLEINHANFSILNTLFTLSGNATSKTTNIIAKVKDLPVLKAKNLLPDQLKDNKIIKWINENVSFGIISGITLALKGSTSKIVKSFNSNYLNVDVQSKGIYIRPITNWETIKTEALTMNFSNNLFTAKSPQALVLGSELKLTEIDVDIANKNKLTLLNFKAKIFGEENQVHDYTLNNPIGRIIKLNDFLQSIKLKGKIEGQIQLTIPLSDKYYKLKLEKQKSHKINMEVDLNDINFQYLNHTTEKLNGKMKITETGVYSSTLTGTIDNLPIEMKFKKPSIRQELDINFKVNSQRYLSFSEGVAKLQGNIKFSNIPKGYETIDYEIRSNLLGTKILLPEQLYKSAVKRLQTKINLKQTKSSIFFEIKTDENLFHTEGEYILKTKGFNYVNLHIGTKNHLNDKNGVQIIFDLPEINVSSWLDVYQKMPKEKNKNSMFDWSQNKINYFNIRSDKLVWKELELTNFVAIQNLNENNDTHETTIVSDETNGQINLNDSTLTVNMDKVKLKHKKKHGQEVCSKLSLISIPNIKLNFKELIQNDLFLGELNLKGSMTDKSFMIDKLTILGESGLTSVNNLIYKATNADNNKSLPTGEFISKTNIDINIDSLKKVFTLLNLENNSYDANNIKLSGDLSWRGSPWCFDKNNLKGSLEIVTGNGNIKGVEPGVARLLSLLNLNIVFKRLGKNKHKDKIEQSNVGMNYEKLELKSRVSNGLVDIKSLRIDSTIAIIKIKGDIDTIKNTHNLKINVKPEILPTAVAIGTILGGPVTGITYFVASEILQLLKLDDKLLSYGFKSKGGNDKIQIIQQ